MFYLDCPLYRHLLNRLDLLEVCFNDLYYRIESAIVDESDPRKACGLYLEYMGELGFPLGRLSFETIED